MGRSNHYLSSDKKTGPDYITETSSHLINVTYNVNQVIGLLSYLHETLAEQQTPLSLAIVRLIQEEVAISITVYNSNCQRIRSLRYRYLWIH